MDSANALATSRKEARENPSWLAAMMINLNRFELETQSIPRYFGLGSASCVVSFEPMSVLYLALGLIAVYAGIVTAMYVGQTWLLFPTALARIARVQLPSSTQHLEVRTPDGESLKGIRTPSREERPKTRRRCLALAGTPGTPRLPLSLCTGFFLFAISSRSTTAAMRQATADRAPRR